MDLLHVDTTDGVCTLTLDDPKRRNALSPDLVDAMVAALDAAEADEAVGAVVVTGAPPAFCAGADLSHLGASREEGLRHIYDGFLRLARSPLPTLAAVNGAAVGAGMNLALAADVRLAGTSARFDTRFLQLGIHPGGGHTWMLRRAVGHQGAAAMVLFGDVLDGPAAAEVGLAWRCVADDELAAEAQRLGAVAAAAPRELARRAKANIAAMADVADHAAAVDAELVDQVWSMDQPAFAERLGALKAKVSSKES